MAKAVVYTLLATAFIILFIFFSNKLHGHTPLGLSRRHGYKAPHFDPLVSIIERSAEEKGLSYHVDPEHISYVPEVEDAHECFDDEGNLNTTKRLMMILFPLLDNAPKDGLISAKELGAWIGQQAIDRLSSKTHKVMSWHDKNGDEAISFNEYLPQFTEADIDENEKGHGEAGWWMEQFNNADVDTSRNLDFNEFKDRRQICRARYQQRQLPGPGGIETHIPLSLPWRTVLRQVLHQLCDVRDGNLTVEEMLNHENIFYNSVYGDSIDDDDFDDIHNEL
ncbi:hypothetical protein CRYUN_Cryun12cG0078500 [Craigia yunnanensis]